MKNLKLFEEFKNLDLIDDVIDRFNKTGYLSKNNQQKLIDITENPFIVKELLDKVEQLERFYKNLDTEYLNDVTYTILDDSPYDYSFEVGWYIPTRYSLSFRSDDINTKVIFQPNYKKEADLNKFILGNILNSIKKFNSRSEELTMKYSEERKKSANWIREPRSRKIKIHDFFDDLTKIQPIIKIELSHKDRENIWYMDIEDLEKAPGFTQKEYSDQYNPDSLTSKIKKSPRFNRFGKFKVYNNGWVDSYTHMRARDDNDEIWENPRPILTHGYLYLFFEL